MCADTLDKQTKYSWIIFGFSAPWTIEHKTSCVTINKRLTARLPVLTVCHPIEKGVLACTMYMVTGLWLAGPELQARCAVESVTPLTTKPSGAPGGPAAHGNKRRRQHGIQNQTNQFRVALAHSHPVGGVKWVWNFPTGANKGLFYSKPAKKL